MSTLENTKMEEKLLEAFELSWHEDRDLVHDLAYYFLDSLEYYLYCKEDCYQYMQEWFEEIFSKLLEAFYDCEGSTYDIRALCNKIWG